MQRASPHTLEKLPGSIRDAAEDAASGKWPEESAIDEEIDAALVSIERRLDYVIMARTDQDSIPAGHRTKAERAAVAKHRALEQHGAPIHLQGYTGGNGDGGGQSRNGASCPIGDGGDGSQSGRKRASRPLASLSDVQDNGRWDSDSYRNRLRMLGNEIADTNTRYEDLLLPDPQTQSDGKLPAGDLKAGRHVVHNLPMHQDSNPSRCFPFTFYLVVDRRSEVPALLRYCGRGAAMLIPQDVPLGPSFARQNLQAHESLPDIAPVDPGSTRGRADHKHSCGPERTSFSADRLSDRSNPEMEEALALRLRNELGGLKKLSEVRRRARAAGLVEDDIDAAGDEDDPRAALIELIVAGVEADGGQLERASSFLPKTGVAVRDATGAHSGDRQAVARQAVAGQAVDRQAAHNEGDDGWGRAQQPRVMGQHVMVAAQQSAVQRSPVYPQSSYQMIAMDGGSDGRTPQSHQMTVVDGGGSDARSDNSLDFQVAESSVGDQSLEHGLGFATLKTWGRSCVRERVRKRNNVQSHRVPHIPPPYDTNHVR